MKLKLTYSPGEAREADLIVRFTKARLSGSKVRRDKSKGSKLAVYVTTSSLETLDKSGKTLDPSPR